VGRAGTEESVGIAVLGAAVEERGPMHYHQQFYLTEWWVYLPFSELVSA